MDERQRTQLSLIIAHKLSLAERATNKEANALYASMSAKGTLGSGATILAIDKVIRGIAETLLVELVDEALAISADLESHECVTSALAKHFENVTPEFDRAIKMATRGQTRPSVDQAAQDRFAQVKADIEAQLAIARFKFDVPLDTDAPYPSKSTAAPPKNTGGKPLAEHWDAMWADIAFRLWIGDLKPKRQKDISDAMFDWLSAQRIESGPTAVTDRARALWQRIERHKLEG